MTEFHVPKEPDALLRAARDLVYADETGGEEDASEARAELVRLALNIEWLARAAIGMSDTAPGGGLREIAERDAALGELLGETTRYWTNAEWFEHGAEALDDRRTLLAALAEPSREADGQLRALLDEVETLCEDNGQNAIRVDDLAALIRDRLAAAEALEEALGG